MSAFLFRSGSIPVQNPAVTASPKASISRQDSIFGCHSAPSSPRISLQLNSNDRRSDTPARGIRRAFSESDIIRSVSNFSGTYGKLKGCGSQSFPAMIPEEEYPSESKLSDADRPSEIINRNGGASDLNYAGCLSQSGIPLEELGVGISCDGGMFTKCSGGERSKIRAYYKELVDSNPTDSLVLRNYGKYLQEVEKDTAKAEEYYGRAILANPGDGELLSLYGKLIWETERDEERAKSYFHQAVYASPDDCMVLGSYAQFMWEAEEIEGVENEGIEIGKAEQQLVAAAF